MHRSSFTKAATIAQVLSPDIFIHHLIFNGLLTALLTSIFITLQQIVALFPCIVFSLFLCSEKNCRNLTTGVILQHCTSCIIFTLVCFDEGKTWGSICVMRTAISLKIQRKQLYFKSGNNFLVKIQMFWWWKVKRPFFYNATQLRIDLMKNSSTITPGNMNSPFHSICIVNSK